MQGVSDSSMWQKEVLRQFLAVRGALRSLQLQAEAQRRKTPSGRAVRELSRHFAAIDTAFEAMSITEDNEPTGGVYQVDSRGRREFLSDLKGDDR